MAAWKPSSGYHLRALETPEELTSVEELQRLVWPGNETDIVPVHMLLAAIHNGGFVIGAYSISAQDVPRNETSITDVDEFNKIEIPAVASLVGFVYGFPGFYLTPDGPRPKHCSHMMGVHPKHRDQGIGFALKRAQWQMVRNQGLDRITWTYDPLLSRNAHLNITRLGAVSNTYLREVYGQMRDGLNVGLPSDRFQVDWWVNSQRVSRRLSRKRRRKLDLAHFLAAGTVILNPTESGEDGLPHPPSRYNPDGLDKRIPNNGSSLVLAEIPADFMTLKANNITLAQEWRMHSRTVFEDLFRRGYLVTDFIYLPGTFARSFYVLSHGESTL